MNDALSSLSMERVTGWPLPVEATLISYLIIAPLGIEGGNQVTLMVTLSTIGVVVKNVLDIFTVLVTSSGGLDTGVKEIRTKYKYI